MIRDLKKLYALVKNNEVIMFRTNLKDFVCELNILEPGTRNYSYYCRRFEKEKNLEYVNEKGEVYNLQQVYP